MNPQDRLREPPEPRFAEPQHLFDLAAEVRQLRQEPSATTEGHRQKTLYKHGPTTVALFLFAPAARLPRHTARGVVLIHVIRGHLQVTAQSQSHELHTGQLLALAPGVDHDVLARAESEMLLTVTLQPAPTT